MREAWLALWLVAALAGGWRLGLSPVETGLLASGAVAVALGLRQLRRLQAERRRAGRPRPSGRGIR